jgi:hypothetical protein
MNRKTHRRLASILLGAAVLVLAAAGALLLHALLADRAPRDFDALTRGAEPAPDAGPKTGCEPGAIRALAGKAMTRTIVKPPPAAPPKPPAPTLDSLIALAGVLEVGGAREAVIEVKKARRAKNYREGDAVEDTGVIVTTIRDAVTVTYDGKTYKLTVGGRGGALEEP